ncbi:CRE-CPNA-1 protein [Caenorhabditis remanei]|uniref:CRE-CPNA-1 protein n=1 Tax=Caenorhabditis remanei TaxID=31234 RepID=E3MU47_CAERE|nr:CRE-CPNA-1 protein [Caenorhabditis remanei]
MSNQNVAVVVEFRESYVRDSQLTDYDISDFNAHEEPHYHTVLTPQQLQYQQQQQLLQQQQQQRPSAIQEERRRTTADSDDYVKVSEPIYDYPPKTTPTETVPPKRISPTEAAQLQELYQEYDLGLDLPGVAPIGGKPPVQQQGTRPLLIQQQQVQSPGPNFNQGVQGVAIRQNSVPESPRTVINVPISRKTDVPIQQNQQNQFSYNVPIQVKDDPRNLATADLFVQDALEYIGHQQNPDKGQFVMEEEMLSSHEPALESGKKKLSAKNPSFEATSRQVRTNDVFERVETDEHDDMTYAPEIQSVEIPPDQMSETSENMIDYFDKVAAESEQQIQHLQQQHQNTLKKQTQQIEPSIPDSSLLKPVGRAPQILPAFGNRAPSNSSLGSDRRSGSGVSSSDVYPYRHLRKQSSLLSVLGVTSMQEMLLTITSLDSLSEAMRKAGLETTNLIFGIDYTASNKYQGEESFGGRSLHTIHPHVKNPYQQVITILGRTLAPFAGQGKLGVYGFGDAKTGDWSVFNLKGEGDCRSLDEVLNVYNTVTPTVALSGPTNFAPLIYQAMEICQKSRDYHILVIIADGQVTNERATRRAIVQACQHPLSIIVVGVGDGPWDMMRIFDESLPKRPWDNFHFVEFHDIIKKSTSLEDGDVKVAVQSLLEIPDQYRCICELGLLDRSIPPRGSEIRREMMHNPL